jgi:polar amino acid transport system substrate-binding protein
VSTGRRLHLRQQCAKIPKNVFQFYISSEEEVKRITLVTLSVLIILSMLLVGCAPKSAKVRIATDATFPPFETVDEQTKQLTGFDIELMNAIAKSAGFEIEWTNANFDAIDAGIANCQYDALIAAMTITDARKENRLFSEPYVKAGQILTVKIGNTAVKTKDDLSGKKVGAQIGTTGAIEAGKISGAELKTYDQYDLAFLDLMNGQIDAVIADFPTAFNFVKQYSDKLTLTGDVFTDEYYGIAVCKTKTDLLTKINAGLAAVTKDGTLDTLKAKWLQVK